MNPTDIEFWSLFSLFVFAVLLLCVTGLVLFFRDFSKELKRINLEIRRTRGEEQKYWKSRKRRLWLSLIPFVRY